MEPGVQIVHSCLHGDTNMGIQPGQLIEITHGAFKRQRTAAPVPEILSQQV